MQEDKNLKELLMKYAVEETSADFTMNVMQRIESANAAKLYQTSLLKHKLLRVVMVAFALVCILLLTLCIFMRSAELPFQFSIKLPAQYFSQIISFLIAFWVVMFINQLWNKKRTFSSH